MQTPNQDTISLSLCGALRDLRPALLLAFLPLLLTGCFLWPSASDSDEPVEVQEEQEAAAEDSQAKEIKPSDGTLSTEAPEQELIRSSKRLYQAGLYSVAQDSLNAIRDRYPLGAYGSWAAIKAADAHYYNGEFDKAAKLFEEFLKNYPGSPDTPYVKLQAARAHLASAKGRGRDRQPLERSLTLFDELAHDYPHTPYAILARSERTPALEDLVAYDRFIIDFYRKKENSAAVTAREQLFDQRWGARIGAGEFKETSEEIPLEPLAEIEPGTELARRVEATEAAAEAAESPPQIISPELVEIQRVQCDRQDIPFAMIEISRFPESYSTGNVIEKIQPNAGLVQIPDIAVTALQRPYSCFGQDDLVVNQAGTIELRSDYSFILTTLDSPPRILLTRIAQ